MESFPLGLIVMKIATLTINLQSNYGNALQSLALQRFVADQGFDTELVSHWSTVDREEIRQWHNYVSQSPVKLLIFALSCLTWTGKFCAFWKERRISKWITNNLRWSLATAIAGKFPAEGFKYDAVVVGSDQVWNSGNPYVRFNLLPDFPEQTRRIAYAASFNAGAFTDIDHAYYLAAFSKFSGMSVRESSSVDLIRREFGITPEHVCDPVLFYNADEWCSMLNIRRTRHQRPYYMCYIVSPDGVKYYRRILEIAKKSRKPVHVYAFDCNEITLRGGGMPSVILRTIVMRLRLFFAGVRLHFAATPDEFIARLADCDGLFTDSFHGLMFATIFGRRCNVVIGENRDRIQMQSKIMDFVRQLGDQAMVSDAFDENRLKKLQVNEYLLSFVSRSRDWLRKALGACAAQPRRLSPSGVK